MPRRTGARMLCTAVAAGVQCSHPLPPGHAGGGAVRGTQEVACACLGAGICSAVCAAGGRSSKALLEWFPRQDAGGFFVLFYYFFLSDTHVAVIHSHVCSPFWEEHGQSLEIEGFTEPLLCLGELFLYPTEVGKPGWQYMPRNPAGLLCPKPKPPTAWLQCSWLRWVDPG